MASPSRQSKPHHQPHRTSSSSKSKTKPQPNITNEREGGGEGRREKGRKKTQEEEAVVMVVGGGDIESGGCSVVDDLELTDSLSTGEFPSDVTFR